MTFLPVLLVSTMIFGGVQGPQQETALQEARLSLSVEQAEVHEVLTYIANLADANLVISPEVEGQVTCRLRDLHWRSALDLVAEQQGCVVEDFRGVLRVSPRKVAEKSPRVQFNFLRADVQEVVSTIARLSGANVVLDSDVQGKITLRLKNIPWREALEIIAETSGWVVEDLGEGRNILRIRNR